MRVLLRFSDVRLAGAALANSQAIWGTGKRIVGVKRGVQGPWDFVRRCCFWGTLTLLSACETFPQTFDVQPFLREQITGDTARACLAREYQAQAIYQVRHGRHWAQASLLAAKGRRALTGAEIVPENVPEDLAAEGDRLSRALQFTNRNACSCATAQARLDGWILAKGNDPQADFEGPFADAIAACATTR